MRNDSLAIDALKTHLLFLATEEIKPRDVGFGICYEINYCFTYKIDDVCFYTWTDSIDKCMKAWPLHSGDPLYPIAFDGERGVWLYENTKDLWGDDEYGDLRRSLCFWLYENLEDYL
jgi:hypothetical protein